MNSQKGVAICIPHGGVLVGQHMMCQRKLLCSKKTNCHAKASWQVKIQSPIECVFRNEKLCSSCRSLWMAELRGRSGSSTCKTTSSYRCGDKELMQVISYKLSHTGGYLIQVIDKDVRRTCPEFAFFQSWSTYVKARVLAGMALYMSKDLIFDNYIEPGQKGCSQF